MYQMTPIYRRPTDDTNEHTAVVVKAVLLVGALIGITALALIVLAGINLAWLHFVNWCGEAFTLLACRLYLAVI